MLYVSTRDKNRKVSSSHAIKEGIAPDGGLYMPESLPCVGSEEIKSLTALNYNDRAKFILKKLLTDFTEDEISKCVDSAYTAEKFDTKEIAPVKKLSDSVYMLELWHGPTCAFKDMALQLLPHLLTLSLNKTGEQREAVILVATSGDTGKAALEGFRDVPGTKIMVFYPEDGVSKIQKLQMVTQQGANVFVCGLYGNFDDAQNGVKAIFTDNDIKSKLNSGGYMLSSANSINWGRLAPQIVYYFSTYSDMVNGNEIKNGEKINIAVPTGNFGNILAAYFAKCMGLPVNKLICASNSNNVLTQFIKTGVYDRNRTFYTTISPSMDILISSNLERLLFNLYNYDDNKVTKLMNSLKVNGSYNVDDKVINRIKEHFDAGYCDEKSTMDTIKNIFARHGYLTDTHTAVAIYVYEQYRKRTGDLTKTVIASTASPYKFSESVLNSLTDIKGHESADDFDMIERLYSISNLAKPYGLTSLKDKEVRFNNSCDKDKMQDMLFEFLSKNKG